MKRSFNRDCPIKWVLLITARFKGSGRADVEIRHKMSLEERSSFKWAVRGFKLEDKGRCVRFYPSVYPSPTSFS
jgi:hypothetical protein